MNHYMLRKWLAFGLVLLMGLAWGGSVSAQTITGTIISRSVWRDLFTDLPPGNGDTNGWLRVRVLAADGTAMSVTFSVTNGTMPLLRGPYTYPAMGSGLTTGVTYRVQAWIDGDANGQLDGGEPWGEVSVLVPNTGVIGAPRITVKDSNDLDTLPDWWEYHWFFWCDNPLQYGDAADPDNDGLSNLQEATLAVGGYGLDFIDPANWDSDGDDMDDGWEVRYFVTDALLTNTFYHLKGMNPMVTNDLNDFDGDGLSEWQEYCGIDGNPRMIDGPGDDGIVAGQVVSTDDLNPLDVDSDYDLLLDSFEAAWYDPGNHINPMSGKGSIPTNGVLADTTYAQEDSDRDGLSNFREQCLLEYLHQASTNRWIWDWTDQPPFVFNFYNEVKGATLRICVMTDQGGGKLNLGLVPGASIPATTNRYLLRNPTNTVWKWTDPTEGTGYSYANESIPPGHDSDEDGLPDGWEIQFNLNPREDGFGVAGPMDGPFGDPDGDGLYSIEEYYGQDELRSVTYSYVNGTGDETNPNEYHWRPDSTYSWRWYNADLADSLLGDVAVEMGDPRVGAGISRGNTLGSALPTAPLGAPDLGTDSDDDGIIDLVEINPAPGAIPSSPVDSCDPFIPRSALITSTNGIPIPVPEPAASNKFYAAGSRQDLQRQDWTLECQVKLLSTNLSGDLFNFKTVFGEKSATVYQLALSNNAPVLMANNTHSNLFTVSANSLPTNQWVHLAAVWDHLNNRLTLYIDGVLAMAPQPMGASISTYMLPATNTLALAVSTNGPGSFVGKLMLDEVRIWGLARTAAQISEYAHKLVPAVNGDDVWIAGTDSDTIIVHGGGIFGREPGVLLSNVCKSSSSYWLDDGDTQFDAAKDTLLVKGSDLKPGLTGTLVDQVFWNDKDNSGDFTRNALLAYYRFDDGGSSAEDFARRAKNGLLGATSEEFRFGDRGYALSTNAFAWVTNTLLVTDAALVYGVDKRGADDSDHDGLPDGWELINGLDPWEDGTWQETLPGAKDGPNGPKGDLDHDGLNNLYEFWSGTNPRSEDSDADGVLDIQEDRDVDRVVNIIEQLLGSRPDIVDTDDDGFADNEEQSAGTSPINAVDPATNSLAVAFAGSSGDYLEIPVNINQRMPEWTLEAWVMPSNVTSGAGVIVRRVVEALAGGTQAVNYVMGLEDNGAGGLQMYAGYIWPDGRQYLVRGGTVVPTNWTHLAASYSKSSAALMLYTNGVLAAGTNTFYDGPPVSGRGGETFVRIGEDFGGAIDEVRLWNKVRSPTQIQANTNRVISASDTNGLVNYFRFDDSQANTNLYAWSEFHQPAGFQDFIYDRDWNAEWRHAAIRHGNVVAISPGAIISPPSLRVMLQPDEAIAGGAQWCLDGGPWQNSGVSLQGLDPGEHVVMFKEVAGWTAPDSLPLTLINGRAITTNGVYVQKAALKISFNNVPVPPLAAWQVNGGAWMTNGMTLTNLNAGANLVSYREVPGYIQPPTETVTLLPGQTLSLIRPYTIMTATISAIITPAAAAAAGARWLLDGGTGQVSGAVVGGLAMTTHQVAFSTLSRWITPATISVTPTNQIAVVVTGVYSQVSGLAVDLLPAEAVATGAQWRVSGGGWTNSGVLIPLPAGTYTVDFKPVSAGWIAPVSQTVLVTNQQVTEVSAAYLKADIFGGTVSTNAGDFVLPQGLDSDPLHRLFVADTYNDRVQMYDALSQQWTVWGNFGTSLGQFKKPSGLAVDKLGNLYVADPGNHRIQKRIATNGLWVAVGSNTLASGAALGQFNAPADVAVDSTLSLYVADTANSRVQRVTTAGVWSVFITNGTAAGRVQYPQGLHIDSSDNLYVSDDGLQTNGLNRVQKFAKSGQYLTLLGGRDSAQGGLQDPFGMTIGNGNLYVANTYDSRVAYSDMTGLTWTTLVGSNVLSKPGDVEWDSRGYLYIADTYHNRILIVQIDPAAATNGLTQLTAMTSSGTNTSFTLTWFARLNWNYAVQYASTLAPSPVWSNLPGYSAVMGLDMMTNCTDTTVLGVTNRFYRIIAY